MKELSLDFRGYEISGCVDLLLWGDLDASIVMKPFFLTPEQLSAGAIKRNINDGGFGCQRILSATLSVHDVYGENYKQFNRHLELDVQQCNEAMLGI